MSVNECGGTDPHCGCVVVWSEGRRFVRHCGQQVSQEEYLFKTLESIKKSLKQIEYTIQYVNLAP